MNRLSASLLAIVLSSVEPAPLAAQDTNRPIALDVALGVSMNDPTDVNRPPRCTELGLPCTTPRTLPDGGLVAQVGLSAFEHAALVAEASLYNDSWIGRSSDVASINHVGAILVGPRIATGTLALRWYKDTTRYRAFVQILGGRETSTVLPTRVALQPGGGVDGQLGWNRAWIRVAYDYRMTRGGPRNLSGSRLLCGLALDVVPRSTAP